ncbi:TPA: DEAD/DEAH box helicase family protein [Bacillus cereus]|nr:DEAD/DEAH box helicase family protein [Bacillus cereus]
MTVKVIDAICGAGKTSYAIQYMNEHMDKLFIYVTPFLTEVERIKTQTIKEFFEPNAKSGNGKKINHVKTLVEEAVNIVMTHELFARLDEETLFNIKKEGYVLIMDEVANVLDTVSDVDKDDIRVMVDSNLIKIEGDGQITWLDPLYQGKKFNDIKILSLKKNLFLHNNSIIFWTMPVSNFKSFKDVYILTYLFDGQIQKYYYEMKNISYEKYSVQRNDEMKYELVTYDRTQEPRNLIGSLLTIYEDYQSSTGRKSSMNSNYLNKKNNPDKALSKNWYDKADAKQIEQIKKNLVSIFRTQNPVSNDELFWTSFKGHAASLKNVKCKLNKKDDRSKDNFVPFNTRATNDYADRKATAFLLNRFMNPNEYQFFSYRGVEVDEELLAISDLIQFLFRGCIRNNEQMYCYIPSARMRRLLKGWINFEI